MERARLDRIAIAATALAVVGVIGFAAWRIGDDAAAWTEARQAWIQHGYLPDAPAANTGQMRRRRGQE